MLWMLAESSDGGGRGKGAGACGVDRYCILEAPEFPVLARVYGLDTRAVLS